MSGSLPQLQTFQLPDVGGVVNALQGLELNRMRSQQLQGAEQERNATRELFSRPGFDPFAPGSSNELLRVAPTTGAATFQALMRARADERAGQASVRQAQTALTENEIKSIELGQALLRPVRDLPEAERPRAYATWLAGMERRIPGFSASAPREYSDAGYYTLLAKASEIVANQRPPQYTITPTSGGVIATDPKNPTNSFFVPAGDTPPNAPPPPGAPAPRAAAPGLTPGQAAAADFLRRREGFREAPYYDVNAYRAGFGSDTTTLPDGTVVPVRQGMTVSREDAERDLARRIPEFERRAAAAIGEERFAALPPNAQAALISIAYNYGTLPGRIREAARSGDLVALSQAVAGLAGDNQGVNAGRRREEATMIAGGNAMAPNAAPANAMLAPPDAAVVPPPLGTPEFPGLPRPATLSDADLLKRIRDVQSDEAKARMLEQIRRETAASRAAEEGEKAGSIRRGQLTAEQERKDREKLEGRQRLESVLRDMNTQYERLTARGGIPSESRSAGANIGAFAAGTAPGQMVGRALATPSQTARNQIESLRNELLQAFKAATGMGAKEADSNADVLRLMSAMSDTTMSIESVRGIMQNFSKRYGLGELNFPETPAPAPAAAPRDGVLGQRRGAAAPAQGQYQEGQTATGPNGQRVIFRGGQWVPVQ